MNTSIIKLNNVSKTFYPPLAWRQLIKLNFKKKDPVLALKNINLGLQEGKITGILGPNGAGKTTLLKCISTLILPDHGAISVRGYNVQEHDNEIKSIIGLVSAEERSFYWRLTGLQNLQFYSCLYDLDRNHAKLRIKKLFEIF